ncbi:MAG: disulfide bond formation protein DsbA [Thiotrichales bacterium]|jgi:2-hydroxychromene-2-carboxylate isomerase|nr:disulfide bond formation protein DsbA [Thiotrichales bacterium]|tara:strand:+ start:2390 stop:3058 length:669 start_codon:yes stop_codon:yes gene_type:complete
MENNDSSDFSFDLFWSFRSPFCYLGLDRILEIKKNFDVTVNVRPVFPLAIRIPDFFKKVNPKYRGYHLKDSQRVADHLGIPYRRPIPDPIIQDLETNAIATEQPYIRQITLLGAACQIEGSCLPFVDHVSRKLWDGSVDGWHDNDHLLDALNSAGLNGLELMAKVESETDKLEAVIAKNQTDQENTDHWGVPLMTFRGETFYGQDRIETLLWRMRDQGLLKR